MLLQESMHFHSRPETQHFAYHALRQLLCAVALKNQCLKCDPRWNPPLGRATPQRKPFVGALALRIKVRSAAFTDFSSGKNVATSGDSSTRFVPLR